MRFFYVLLKSKVNITNINIIMTESNTSIGAGIGLLAGIIIGSATDNVGLWIALGLCFGAGIGSVLEKIKK